MKQYVLILPVLILMLLVMGATPVSYEGTAAVSANFPDAGLYVATNAFPRNTMVELTNLETGKTARAVVSAGLNSPGLLAELSREAAASVEFPSRSYGRIRLRAVSDPLSFSQTSDTRRSGDPDFDPRAAATQYGAATPYTYTQTPVTSSYDSTAAIDKQIAEIKAESNAARAEAQAARAEAQAARKEADAARADARMALSEARYGRSGAGYEQPSRNSPYTEPSREEDRYSPYTTEPGRYQNAPPVNNEEIARVRDEAKKARDEADNAKRIAESAKKEAETAKKTAEDVKTSLAIADGTSSANNANYKEELDKIKAELERLKKDAEEAKKELAIAKADVERALKEAEAAKEEARFAKAEAEKSFASIDTIKEEIAKVKTEAQEAKMLAENAMTDIQKVREEAKLGSEASAEEIAKVKAEVEEAKNSAEKVIEDSKKIDESAEDLAVKYPKEFEAIKKDIEETRAMAQKALDVANEAQAAADSTIAQRKEGTPGSYDYRFIPDHERPPVYDGSGPIPVFSVPTVTRLEFGKYYLQIGASRDKGAVEWELNKLRYTYPLSVLYVNNTTFPYRILVGPVNQNEAGPLLKKLHKSGYKEAFLRKGE